MGLKTLLLVVFAVLVLSIMQKENKSNKLFGYWPN